MSAARPERPTDPPRCAWMGDDTLMIAYHDEEWGSPLRDDRQLFEFLALSGFQAGLSWRAVLRKREGFRRAFAGFDPEQVARFDEAACARLREDAAIIRNRAKIAAAVRNAGKVLALRDEAGSFADWLWAFVDGHPVHSEWRALSDIPARTPLSDRVSRALGERGFQFVGSTIVYAFLQSVGIVNDHVVTCFRWRELVGQPRTARPGARERAVPLGDGR